MKRTDRERAKLEGNCIAPAISFLRMLLARFSLSQFADVDTLPSALTPEATSLRETVANLPAAAIYNDGEYLLLNRAAEQLTGYTCEEISTLDGWFRTIYRERADAVQAFYRQNKAERFPTSPVVPLTHKDGTTRHVQFVGYVTAGGEVWMLHDLTERVATEVALTASEERWQLALKGSNDGIWDWNLLTNEVFFSARWKSMLGFEPDELPDVLETWATRVHPDDLAKAMECVQNYLGNLATEYALEHRMKHKDESWVWILARGLALFDESGKPYRMIGSHTDITERKKSEAEIRLTKERLEAAQRVAQLGSWEYDLATGSIAWSKSLFQILDLDPAQGEPDYATNLALYHPEDAALLDLCVKRAVTEGLSYELDLRRTPSEGKPTRWYHGVGRPVKNESGKVIRLVGTLQDITERKRVEEELATANRQLENQIALVHEQAAELEAQKLELEAANRRLTTLSITDGLTGLNNHRALQEKVAEEFERTQRYKTPVSLVLLDVDKFKSYNDTFGHPEGDLVLKKVAQILQTTARETDYVCRYGGEEFVVVLTNTDSQGAEEAAERFRSAIEGHFWKFRPVTASFGVSTLDADLTTAQELIGQADKALYDSKAKGRNCVTHFADLASREAVVSPSETGV